MDTQQSKCLLCPLGCDIAFRLKGKAAVGPEFCPTGGPHSARVCARGLYGTELLSHPQRVAEPLVRHDGKLREASWPAAVDALSSALKSVVATHGAGSVAVVTEPTRSVAELEAVGGFADRLGAGAVSCLLEPQDWPLVAGGNSAGVDAIHEAGCVIVLGDVFFSHAVLAKEIIDAKYTARGNSLFVIDPRRSNTAWYASEHVQNRPGSEALILASVLKALRSAGKAPDAAYAWLDSVDEKALLDAADVGRDSVARMARAFADAGKGALVVAPPARGVEDVALVAHLARLIADAAGENKACVLLPSGGNVGGAVRVAAEGNWTPVSRLVADLAAGKYRALVCFGADPLASFPSTALGDAVSRLDLVASVSLFRGAVEGVSSVVLAGATWLESDGTAVLFDGSTAEWQGVVAPSWGCRTLPDVIALLDAALGQPGASRPRGDADMVSPHVSESTLAARIEKVKAACMVESGAGLALVTLPATGHLGAGTITGRMQWARDIFPGGFIELNSREAASLGIADNDCVVVESTVGCRELRAVLTDRIKAGVAAVPGYDSAARGLFAWEPGADDWFSSGPGAVRVSRKQ